VLLWFLFPALFAGVFSGAVLLLAFVWGHLAQTPLTFPEYWQDRTALVSEIETLRDTVTTQSAELAASDYAQTELQAIRNTVGAAGAPLVLGNIIARPPYTPYDVLVVDVGKDNGVTVGASVYVGAEVVIGTVEAVFANSAVITLFSTPGIHTNAYIVGPQLYAESEGQGNGVLKLSVPQGVALAVGDPVILPGFAAGYIGRISNVTSIATEPVQSAYVTIPVSVQALRYVRIGSAPAPVPTMETLRDTVASARQRLQTYIVHDVIPSATSTATTTLSATTTIEEI